MDYIKSIDKYYGKDSKAKIIEENENFILVEFSNPVYSDIDTKFIGLINKNSDIMYAWDISQPITNHVWKGTFPTVDFHLCGSIIPKYKRRMISIDTAIKYIILEILL